jgi:hypothetical protein
MLMPSYLCVFKISVMGNNYSFHYYFLHSDLVVEYKHYFLILLKVLTLRPKY